MSQDESRQKWNIFVDIGTTIHDPNVMNGKVRILQAKLALKFADSLIENDYITDSVDRIELFRTLL